MAEKYNVIFSGNIAQGFDEATVQDNIVRLLKIPEQQRAAFFSGKEITLKKDLNLDEALKLKSQLEQLGLTMTMVSTMMADMYASLEQSQAEKQSKIAEQKVVNQAQEEKEARRQAARDEYAALMAQKAEDEAVEVDKPPAIFSLSLQGRFGRLHYLNAALLSFVVVIIIVFLWMLVFMSGGDANTEQAINNSILLTVINLLYSLISLRFGILRLHDVNLSGWYLILGFVPLISGLFSLYLLFAPGTDGENDYGHQPREGNKLGLFGLAFFVVALFWFGWG